MVKIVCPHCKQEVEMDPSTVAKQLGKRGGAKTKERGRTYFARIGKEGLRRRWGPKRKG